MIVASSLLKCSLKAHTTLKTWVLQLETLSSVLNMHLKKCVKAQGFLHMLKMLDPWTLLRWLCFFFVSVAVSVRWYFFLVLHLPLLWLVHCKCMRMTSSCLAVLCSAWQQAQLSLAEIGWVYIAFHKTLSTAYISSVSASVSVHASLE